MAHRPTFRHVTAAPLILSLAVGISSQAFASPTCENRFNPKVAGSTAPQTVAEMPEEKAVELVGLREALLAMALHPELKQHLHDNPYLLPYVAFKFVVTEAPKGVVEASERLAYQGARSLNPRNAPTEDQFSKQLVEIDRIVKQAMLDPKIKAHIQQGPWATDQVLVNRILKDIDPDNYMLKADNRAARIEWSRLFSAITGINKRVHTEMNQAQMDLALRHFNTYLRHPDDPSGRVRAWSPDARPNLIQTEDAGKLSMPVTVALLAGALETEAPFVDHKTGYPRETATYLMPFQSLAQFVGKVDPQLREDSSCSGGWCSEEGRHPKTLLMVINLLTGQKHSMDDFRGNDVEPIVDLSPNASLDHLLSRMTSEIGASGAYVMITNNITGASKSMVQEVMRDEMKHLSIFGTAYQYLTGSDPMASIKRRLGNYKSLLGFAFRHTSAESGRTSFDQKIPNAVAIQLLSSIHEVELQIQKYLRTVPFISMVRLFDTEIARPEGGFRFDSPTEQLSLDLTRAQAQLERVTMSGWSDGARAKERDTLGLVLTQEENLKWIIKRTPLRETLRQGANMSYDDVVRAVEKELRQPGMKSLIKEAGIENTADASRQRGVLFKKWLQSYVDRIIAAKAKLLQAEADAKGAHLSDAQARTVALEIPAIQNAIQAAQQRLNIDSPVKVSGDILKNALVSVIRDQQILTQTANSEGH